MKPLLGAVTKNISCAESWRTRWLTAGARDAGKVHHLPYNVIESMLTDIAVKTDYGWGLALWRAMRIARALLRFMAVM